MSEESKPIILVDGSSYLYRAFHALPPLVNSKGQPTGAVYGVINMLKRLKNDYPTDQIAVIFDAKGKTFRDEMYSEYKATRKAMPEELALQVKPLHEIIRAMGFPIYCIEGVEADDVIGSMTKIPSLSEKEIIISTGDKDLAQLVNQKVTLVNTMSNTTMNPQGVIDKFGIPAELIIDYLALIGDTSDNIPGIPSVGPKTAVKWLKEYGSLDKIVENADKIKGKVGEKLRDNLEQLSLSKQLVTIKKDVELELNSSDLNLKAADKDKLAELFKEMEFKTWLKELLGEAEELNVTSENQYQVTTKATELDKWIKKIQQAKLVAIDTETTSLNYMQAKLVGISLATTAGEATYIPFGHDYENAPQQLDRQLVLEKIKPILEDPNILKIGQNIKYDYEVLANAGIEMQGIQYDTMLESYVLDSTATRHDMDSLALKYLGHKTIPYEEVAGKGKKQVTFNLVAIETAAEYAAEDADITLKLHETLWPKLNQEKSLANVFNEIEIPLIHVLAKMELHGVLIDPDRLKKQGKALEKRLKELADQAYILADGEFNMNSPKQLQEVLFDKLKLPVLQKTPKGQPSTAEAVLQELAHQFELPSVIIEYRSINKLITTYTSKLVEQIHPETGRIHTSYNQAATATGRLSSSDPNLQNIPVKSAEGRKIREAFIAPEGYQLFSADYSQIELRIMAHISKDKGLLHAFANNLDIHSATAAEVWGVKLEDVTSEMRRNAKAINFGLIYGMSAFGLTRQLGIDRQSAQEYIDTYFARYPGVKAYMEQTRALAKEKGYVETIWGRRLYLPEINASKVMRQKAAERVAINAPLQGSAADIIKMTMRDIQRYLEQEQVDAKMIMQVHDELVFEINENQIDVISAKIKELMTHVVKLDVPLLVSTGAGSNWDAASAH